MRTLGLIGGMSWESTAVYYRLLNEGVRSKWGKSHSADLVLISVDFEAIVAEETAGEWDRLADRMIGAARRLESIGADAVMICTTTMHKVAPAVEAAIGIPLIHIVDSTGAAIRRAGLARPLLLGTRYTMEQGFYCDRLSEQFGIDAMLPDQNARSLIHTIIYSELVHGIIEPRSRQAVLAEIDLCKLQGADGVIFGCTEVGLLITPNEVGLPAFDTVHLHAEAALSFALGG